MERPAVYDGNEQDRTVGANLRYRAFISYSHADSRAASWLHRKLESYTPPKSVLSTLPEGRSRLAPIFLDRDELQTAGNLSDVITAALDEAEFLVVLCSPAAAESRWVNEEVLYFRRSGRADRILCVLVEGDPGQPSTIFPEACLFQLAADGTLDRDAPLEPMAADLRPGEDRQRAMVKVAATLLGVRFDDLMQREAHRRQRFLVKVATGASIGMLVTLGLAVFAFVQRDEAELQRQIAEREAATASRVTRTLTTLIQETFTELVRASASENQDGPNRFIRSALANTVQVVNEQLATESDASAEALNVQAAIEQLLGNVNEAETIWLKALVAADPHSQAELLFEIQLSLAELYSLRNEPARGVPLIEAAGEILATSTVAEDQQLIYLLTRAGNISAQGYYDVADERYEEVIAFLETREELSTSRRLDAYNRLSVHYNTQKRLDQALRWANEAIELAEATLPEDSYELIAPHNAAGWAYRSKREFEKSRLHLQKALDLARANFGSKHPQVSDAHNAMGGIAYSQLDMAEAARHFRASLDITSGLYGEEHIKVAGAHSNLATALFDSGQVRESLDHYVTSIDIARALGDRGGRALALVLRNKGRVEESLGHWEEAEQAYREAVDVRNRLFGADSQVTHEAMIHLSNLLSRRGRHEEAAEVFDQAMAAMGEGTPADDPGLISWSYLGWRVALAAGEVAKARQLLEALVVDSGERRSYRYIGDTRTLSELAWLCLQIGELECAKASWEQGLAGLASAPGHPEALFHAAVGAALQKRQGNTEAAALEVGRVRGEVQVRYPARTDLLAILDN